MDKQTEIQREILKALPTPCHGLLNIAPRVGKTRLGIFLIKKHKSKKTLWVTPSTKLRDVDIPEEFKKWKELKLLDTVDIVCYPSLKNQKGKYDLIIFDEYQDLTWNAVNSITTGKIKYSNIIGLSGTHPNNKQKQDIYDYLKLPIIYKMTIDEAVDKKIIAPYNINMIACKLDDTKKNAKSGNKNNVFYTTETQKYDYLTNIINITKANVRSRGNLKFLYLNRARFIYNLPSKIEYAKKLIDSLKGKTLVFSGSIKTAEALSKYTYHSKTNDEDLQAFLNGKIEVLSCVNSGGVGFTFNNIDNLVLVQTNSNNKGTGTQKIARALVKRDSYVANIYILYVKDTVDEDWAIKTLKDFNSSNVKYINSEQ